MKDIRILLCALVFIASCADLPKIRPATDPDTRAVRTGCCTVFPSGKWRFIHSIEAELPGGRQGFVLGVTVISAASQTIECVIMSIEGFVFFDACLDKKLTINRAVYPFDNKAFAEGLMQDIELIFFKPAGPLSEFGLLKNGFPLCRYHLIDGGVIDMIIPPDNSWEIRQYNKDRRLTRTVKAMAKKNTGSEDQRLIPERLVLKAYGLRTYELTMTLVEAVCLSP